MQKPLNKLNKKEFNIITLKKQQYNKILLHVFFLLGQVVLLFFSKKLAFVVM
jgi:small neutral amino acid transporter SnatA (MarC family)